MWTILELWWWGLEKGMVIISVSTIRRFSTDIGDCS